MVLYSSDNTLRTPRVLSVYTRFSTALAVYLFYSLLVSLLCSSLSTITQFLFLSTSSHDSHELPASTVVVFTVVNLSTIHSLLGVAAWLLFLFTSFRFTLLLYCSLLRYSVPFIRIRYSVVVCILLYGLFFTSFLISLTSSLMLVIYYHAFLRLSTPFLMFF